MTENEAIDLYEKLLALLRERVGDELSDHENYVKAIEAEIAAGKQVAVTLKVRPERIHDVSLFGEEGASTGPRGEFVRPQEYSAKEKLEILVNGVGLALLAPPLMADRFMGTLARLGGKARIDTINLGDDQSRSPVFALALEDISTNTRAGAHLRVLFAEIVDEIRHKEPTLGSSELGI